MIKAENFTKIPKKSLKFSPKETGNFPENPKNLPPSLARRSGSAGQGVFPKNVFTWG